VAMLSLLIKCASLAFAMGVLASNNLAFRVDPIDLFWAAVVIASVFALREMTGQKGTTGTTEAGPDAMPAVD
jgi:hypothetical protein